MFTRFSGASDHIFITKPDNIVRSYHNVNSELLFVNMKIIPKMINSIQNINTFTTIILLFTEMPLTKYISR